MLDYKHMTLAAIAGAWMLVSPSSAFAADPSANQSVRKNLHEDFEKARIESMSKRNFVAPLKVTSTRDTEMPCMIERVADGFVLVSVPYDIQNNKALDVGGYYEAKSREQAGDHMRFGGRLFTMIRISGDDTEWSKYQRLVGKEVVAKIRSDNNGYMQIIEARVPR